MKIGIISINAHTKVLNFASPLHSYAFQQFLTRKGYKSVIIDYKPVYYGKFNVRHPYDHYLEKPNKDPKKQEKLLKRWKTLYEERAKRYDRFEEFIEKYYKKTKACYSPRSLERCDIRCDCYICATDVIWKFEPGYGFDKGFFLASKTMEGKGKIAYAASRGASKYTPEQEQLFAKYISDIDHISVREESLGEAVKNVLDVPVQTVVDPVFFHEKEFYHELAIRPQERGYVLIYVVMTEADHVVEAAVRFAEQHNLDVIELSEFITHANYPPGTSHKMVYDIGVEEWLGYMENASYIFTNSFHACCFSVILEKQFYCGKRGGDKVDHMLQLFGLMDRRFNPGDPVESLTTTEIDFERVDKRRRELVAQSEQWLLNAIEDVTKNGHRNHADALKIEIEPDSVEE